MWSFDLSRWSKRSLVPSMIASCTLLIFFYTVLTTNDYSSYKKLSLGYFASKPHNSTVDLSYLSRYNISSTFTYARRSVTTKIFNGERSDLTIVNGTLFPNSQLIRNGDLATREIVELPPLTLQVPSSPDIDTSIMSFGIATGITRLNASLPQLSHWLSNTGCPLSVVSPPHDLTLDLESRIQRAPININLNVTTSKLPFPKAYFSIIKHLYESRTSKTQWLVLIDDDTFVPSLPYLLSHLTEKYDATKPQLIAAMSDDIDQIRKYGLIPFGGGGIFMSLSLAALLASPEIYDKCISSEKNQGDQIFNDCLNKYTDVKPIFDHGLNQMDIWNSPGGYFESGRRMLTVHHWKTWFQFDIPVAAKVAKACGDEGLFMRWKFEDVVLSNGYSIAAYKDGIEEAELMKVEKTWEGEDGRWLHHIGPLREALGSDEKASYLLVDAEVLEGLGVRQIYVRTDGEDPVNGVLELLWLF